MVLLGKSSKAGNAGRRGRSQRGISLVLAVSSFVAIIPMVGLVVDVGVLYAVKARLQASVDGAALAAARALNLGESTAAQADAARRNAVNWFYANFPPGNWATNGTTMSTASVQVYDDATNPNLRHVNLSASTNVPTYFMKWFNVESTRIAATGHATRRDSVVVLVLDRSGSMCTPGTPPCNNSGACGPMKAAAKLFTGQFAAGRDYIGLVSFSDGTFVHAAPTRNFRTVLGYTSTTGSGSGAIDTIQCQGGTNSAQAMAIGYNELYKMALPGALNVLVFESDGLPNTLTMNMWDGTAFGLRNIDSCRDANGKSMTAGGWQTYASRRQWSSGYAMDTGGSPFWPNIPAGPIGSIYSSDPSQTDRINLFGKPFHTSGNNGLEFYSSAQAPNCRWQTDSQHDDTSDIAWLPGTDVFGNSVNPANAYQSGVLMTGSRLRFDSGWSTSQKWTNFHKAALNATDHAAYRARSNGSIPANVFVIGLGGQGSDPPDYTLLQRMANDPQGDTFNTPARYGPCASTPSCITYTSQPQGTFIYSTNQGSLRQAFLKLSSQILRLSQ